ncbi:divergent polysaccharide deacetylase family protein, partial [Rhodovulum adriaticum]|uniref:divergent polysaccharide deacetylase family protein n=1 Tax=Rhodovulum adriaticum TaxID=35804 RepID=UPI001908D751
AGGGAAPEGDAPPPAPPTDAAAPASAAEPEAGALARNARAVELRAGVPLMSVILIDAGEEGVARAALHELSVPVTFAVDPTLSDAGDIVRGYRDAGHEVVTLARGLPPGATPSDLEETMTALLAATDGSVAVLDAATGGFQDDRALSAQMVSLADASGHGLLTYDRGLNGAARMAGQVGVPAATVFRLLDGARDNPFVIRRKLDRALFKARQDGHVIVVGHSYRDTVSAFYEWALEAAADEVQLVPVSAILTRE